MKLVFFLLVLCLGIAGKVSSQGQPTSFDACLPPTADGKENDEECALTYRPPPLGHSIHVSECRFLREQFELRSQVFLAMRCTVSNRSQERVAFFNYGLRYVEAGKAGYVGSPIVLLEAGFEGGQRFSTAHLKPVLEPQETRELRLIAPSLPTGTAAFEVDIYVEALGVGVPSSPILK